MDNKLNVSKYCCPLYKINGIKIHRLVVYEEDQGQHDITVTRQGGGVLIVFQ
jgi:ribosomal protein S9